MPAWSLTRNAAVSVAILLLLWTAMALHTALAMRRYGRRWWVWFPICVFLSVLPAVIVSIVDHVRLLREPGDETAGRQGPRQCPHCRAPLPPPSVDRPPSGPPHCPHCNGPIDETRLA